jgi:hypothetical protein
MFDEHLNRQHRLAYVVRGPEWAFAIPQGDLEALEEVMQLCSSNWNGVNSLIIPVPRTGRLPSDLDVYLTTRPVDQCWLHQALSAEAGAAVSARLPESAQLHDGFDRHQLHPLNLEPVGPETPRGSLTIPRFAGAALRRISLAVWGHIPDEEIPHWRERFDIVDFDGLTAHRALIDGQIWPPGASPLLLTARHMNLVTQTNPQPWPYIFVFDRGSFSELVSFWNLRSRCLSTGPGTPVLGLPRQTLRVREAMESLVRWGRSPEWEQRSPDVFVVATQRVQTALEAALRTAGFDKAEPEPPARRYGDNVQARDRPTYAYEHRQLGGPLFRGTQAATLIVIAGGKTSLSLRRPDSIQVGGRQALLTLRNGCRSSGGSWAPGRSA